jgi:hypothetical protein
MGGAFLAVEDPRYRSVTNHVNIVRNANGMFAYVTVGGLNEFRSTARTISPRSRPFRSASHPASGHPATARGSMSALRTGDHRRIDTLTTK